MHLSRLTVALWLAVILVGCGGRWVANAPHAIPAVRDPQSTFEATLAVLRSSGYQILEMDNQRLFIRTQAHLDGDLVGHVGYFGTTQVTARVSQIAFQVQPDGGVVATAAGYHVRGDSMHFRLAEEIDGLLDAIQRTAAAMPAAAAPAPPAVAAPPAAEPPPPPPAVPAT